MTKLIVSFNCPLLIGFLLTLEIGQIEWLRWTSEDDEKKNAFQAATEVYNDRNKVVAILGAILYFSKILDFH